MLQDSMLRGDEVQASKAATSLLTNEAPVLLVMTHGLLIHEKCVRVLRETGYTLETIVLQEDVEATNELTAFTMPLYLSVSEV